MKDRPTPEALRASPSKGGMRTDRQSRFRGISLVQRTIAHGAFWTIDMKHAVFLFRVLARVCVAASLLAGAGAAQAERLKDLASIQGVRPPTRTVRGLA